MKTRFFTGAAVAIAAGLVGAGLVVPAHATSQASNGKIVFQSDEAGNLDVWTINPDGTAKTNLTGNSMASDFHPAWSSDGKRIAFASRRDGGDREIYVMDADGSNQARLTNEPGRDVMPSWSPNGKKLLFASERDGDFEIYLMDADGTKVRQLTDNTAHDQFPEFSPDGQRILFWSTRGDSPELYVMTADGNGARQLTASGFGGFSGDWSPDGSEIALADKCCVEDYSDIFVMKANGTGLRQLTDGFQNNTNPGWSPDGQKLVFDHGDIELETVTFMPTDIYVINSDGSGLTQLTNTPTVFESWPDWAPGA